MQIINHLFTAALYQPLFNALIYLAYLIPGHSIGWAIIALTLIIRLALYPTSWKTLEQQRRMRALQPKVDALKEKHGTDKTAHSKALMELYASEKVSPFGTCLPMLIQLPVLLVMYRVFIHGLNTSGFDLLYKFTPHLNTINTQWFGLNLTKPEVWVIPILAAGLQFWQTKQMMALQPQPNSKGQTGNSEEDMSVAMTKQMMYIGPLMTFFLVLRVPAALGLYWVATTLFMVAQQGYFMLQPMPELSNTIKTKDNVQVTIRSKSEGK